MSQEKPGLGRYALGSMENHHLTRVEDRDAALQRFSMTEEQSCRPPSGSEMFQCIRAHDWAATPLGSAEGWSGRLKLMVEIVLASPEISSLVYGPEQILIYNDAAVRLYGARHPLALGRPLPETFPESWDTVAPLYARAFAGEVVRVAAQPVDTRGEGKAVDAFDAMLMPVRDDAGAVAAAHIPGRRSA